MKRIVLLVAMALLTTLAMAQENATIIELNGNESMCITGKGPGQDGAINPYFNDKKSFAVIENVGENPFDIRISRDGDKIEIIAIEAKKTIQIELKKSHVLYVDSNAKGAAKIYFKPYQI